MVRELELTTTTTQEAEESQIILYNDEVNSFGWVISSLVDVCEHSSEQAEQCAYIVHYKGRYPVKSGRKKRALILFTLTINLFNLCLNPISS